MNVRTLGFALLVFTSGCSTFFSRSNPEAEKAAQNDGKSTYSATEPGGSEDGKDLRSEKIHHLESTVNILNSRILELEGKLQASQTRPAYGKRQNIDAEKSAPEKPGIRVESSVAANDPGAGFVNDVAVRAFQQGMLLYQQEKFPESILAFSAFLEGNASHPLASSAQYYIGENYYRQGDFAVADQEFQKLSTRFPHAPRVSYALVRLSQSAGALGKTEEARRYRIQAEGLFPKSPALKLFRETPAATADNAHAAAPIATAPDLSIEKPYIPSIPVPEVKEVAIEKPVIETPKVEAPRAAAPSEDLDGPPGGGG